RTDPPARLQGDLKEPLHRPADSPGVAREPIQAVHGEEHPLARTVIGRKAAPVGENHLDPSPAELLPAQEQVFLPGPPPQGYHGLQLRKQKTARPPFPDPRRDLPLVTVQGSVGPRPFPRGSKHLDGGTRITLIRGLERHVVPGNTATSQ